jgi:C_GCAxxG_C_C family probable redox protein
MSGGGKKTETDLLKEVEEKGFKYGKEYHCCSQCVLLATQEAFDLPGEDALKAATGFAGGIGRTGSVCGALSGGVMAFGLLYGRDHESMTHPDPDVRKERREAIENKLGMLVKRLRERFEKEYGSMLCDDIEVKLFGRSFDKWNPEDRKEKVRLGAYGDKCPSVVSKTARWVAEMILEEQSKNNPAKSAR